MDSLALVKFSGLQDPHVEPAVVAEWHGLPEEEFLENFVLILPVVQQLAA